MKKGVLNLLGFALLTLIFGACNDDDVVPVINPIIGEWVAADGQFWTLTVDGEEKSLVEFGMEVLRTNEAGAESAAKDYLQNMILGPIDIEEPTILFSNSNQLSAVLNGEEIEGTWRFLNDRSLLKLIVPDINSTDYNFSIKSLSANELELDHDWEMSYLGEETNTYEVALKVKLIK